MTQAASTAIMEDRAGDLLFLLLPSFGKSGFAPLQIAMERQKGPPGGDSYIIEDLTVLGMGFVCPSSLTNSPYLYFLGGVPLQAQVTNTTCPLLWPLEVDSLAHSATIEIVALFGII